MIFDPVLKLPFCFFILFRNSPLFFFLPGKKKNFKKKKFRGSPIFYSGYNPSCSFFLFLDKNYIQKPILQYIYILEKAPFRMDNWALRENNDSPVGFVDNMQLLWKLQSLDTLMPNDENDASSSTFPDFHPSGSTSDLPDDDDLVDKLFRESLAMQQGIYNIICNSYVVLIF